MNRNIKRVNMDFDQVGRQMGLRPGIQIEGIRNFRYGIVEIVVSSPDYPAMRRGQAMIRTTTPKELFRNPSSKVSANDIDLQRVRRNVAEAITHHLKIDAALLLADKAEFSRKVADTVHGWLIEDDDEDDDDDDDDEEGPEIVGHIFERWVDSPQAMSADTKDDCEDPTFYFRPGGGLFPPERQVEEADVVTAVCDDGSRQIIKNRFGKTDV